MLWCPVREQYLDATRLLLCPSAVLPILPVLPDDYAPDGVEHSSRLGPRVQPSKTKEDIHILAWIDTGISTVGADQQRLHAPFLQLLVLL